MSQAAYDALMAFQRETEALSRVAGRLSWDQETVMPRGAGEQRAEEQGAMQAVLHMRRTDPRVGAWLAEAQEEAAAETETEIETVNPSAAAQLRLISRDYARAVKVPLDLATELARLTSRSQGIWAAARADGDVAAFLPTLKQVVALKREEAAAIAEGRDLYDTMIDDYEPGMKAADLAAIFDAMRPRLVALRARALDAPGVSALSGGFPEEAQLALSAELARRFGYDFAHGRIDKAVHPFSSGSGLDVRITTRTEPTDPFNCLYSTIHEVGHGTYEQNIAPDLRLTPAGRGVSMGVHESQSRIYENQLGRSRAFCGWLFGEMQARFGDIGVPDADAFYRTVNRVHRGFIRTEADEVQYNLHIMLRFDLERALIAGDLAVTELEAAWNDRFEADFGYPVDRASHGILQDVHWSVGLFGYFPTYALGNVYAGCLYAALRRDVPGLDAALAKGDPSPGLDWLREKLQVHGGLMEPRVLIEQACGMPVSAEPLVTYLEDKFSALVTEGVGV